MITGAFRFMAVTQVGPDDTGVAAGAGHLGSRAEQGDA